VELLCANSTEKERLNQCIGVNLTQFSFDCPLGLNNCRQHRDEYSIPIALMLLNID
jgi:hypothetical protein